MGKTIWLCASTLPARLIQNPKGNLPDEIWVSSPSLKTSFEMALSKGLAKPQRGPQVTVVGGSVTRGRSRFFLSLRREKRAGTNFVFFHECCWPLLDIFLLIVRPSAVLSPQVSMDAFPTLNFRDVRKFHLGLRKSLLAFLASPLFKFRMVKDQGRTTLSPVLRHYPSSVARIPYVPRRPNLIRSDFSVGRRVLFVGAVDLIEANEIQTTYQDLARRLRTKAIECSFKDHPNPDLRIGGDLSVYDTCEEPEMPIEFISNSYSVLVGVFSTSLIGFAGLSISLGPIWQNANREEFEERMQFFEANSKSAPIALCLSLDDAEARITRFLEVENVGRNSFPE